MRVLYFVSWGVMNCTFTYATMHTYNYCILNCTQHKTGNVLHMPFQISHQISGKGLKLLLYSVHIL